MLHFIFVIRGRDRPPRAVGQCHLRSWGLVLLAVVLLAGCGGASGGSEVQSLRQEVAAAQASTANWKVIAVVALILGGVIGLMLGGRDES